jgi:hypothetical protein
VSEAPRKVEAVAREEPEATPSQPGPRVSSARASKTVMKMRPRICDCGFSSRIFTNSSPSTRAWKRFGSMLRAPGFAPGAFG